MSQRIVADPSQHGWVEVNGKWMWGASGGGSDLSDYYTKSESDGRYLQDSDLSDYYTKSESDGRYLQDETDPTVPDHVKSISTADINKWNNPPAGGGGLWVEESPGVIKYAGTAKATDVVATG